MRLASANIHRNPAALARLAQEASVRSVDVILAYEAAPLNLEELRRLFPAAVTIRMFDVSETGEALPYPLLLVAHIPVDGIRLERMGERAILEVEAYSGGTSTRLVAAHTVSPGSARDAQARKMLLRSLGERVPSEGPYLVAVDFNATPWSPIFADLPGTRAGNPAREATWPLAVPGIGLPIDHVLFGGGLRLTGYEVGPDIGSDHRPLFATFATVEPARP